MKYTIWYNNNVENRKVAEFDTFVEARQFCLDNTRGYDEVADNDNDYEGRGNNFHYEVYFGEPIEIVYDEDGEVGDEKTIMRDVIYQTEQYYSR